MGLCSVCFGMRQNRSHVSVVCIENTLSSAGCIFHLVKDSDPITSNILAHQNFVCEQYLPFCPRRSNTEARLGDCAGVGVAVWEWLLWTPNGRVGVLTGCKPGGSPKPEMPCLNFPFCVLALPAGQSNFDVKHNKFALKTFADSRIQLFANLNAMKKQWKDIHIYQNKEAFLGNSLDCLQ